MHINQVRELLRKSAAAEEEDHERDEQRADERAHEAGERREGQPCATPGRPAEHETETERHGEHAEFGPRVEMIQARECIGADCGTAGRGGPPGARQSSRRPR